MALSSLRLRRVLTFSSSLIRNQRSFSALTSSVLQSNILSSSSDVSQNPRNHTKIQSYLFHSSVPSLLSSRSYNNDDDKISPDTILFEGCDYNHWLITMDFPKDPKPTPEEMVETYVQTLAKVVGSVEEAKKRMYACSTTTYTGFQAVMTEEMSEKFRGLPGVVFILPDSYIDPVNKEYGGDKYINGEIIHRPPPIQYGRQGGRYGDRNRNYDRPRFDRPMQQGNQPYDRQAPMQGDGRNQPYDRQAPMQGDGRNQPYDRQAPMQDGRNQMYDRQAPTQGDGRNQPYRQASVQGDGRNQPYDRQDFTQGDGRNQPYDHQATMQGDGRNFRAQQGYPPQPNYGQVRGQQPNYGQVAAQQPNYGQVAGHQPNYGQVAGQQPNYGQVAGQGEYRDAMPTGGRDYAPVGDRGNYPSQERRDYAPAARRGFGGDDRNFSPPPSGGYGQGDASGFRQSYPGPGEGQTFPQVQQSNGMQEKQGGYMPMEQTRNEPGRY